jgi:hypothetical protein
VSGLAEDEAPPAEEPTPGEEEPPEEPPSRPEQPPEEPAPRPESPREPPAGPSLDEIAAQIRAIPIGSFLLSTLSTLASIAYGKLEADELDEARGAIDAVSALLPVLEGRVEPALKRDFEQALANLQVSYVDASAKASS